MIGRALIGTAIGSIRRVQFGLDAQSALTSPRLVAIEFETKAGRYAHFVARPDATDVVWRAGAAQPTETTGRERVWTDLTAALPLAFDGRPAINAVRPLPDAMAGEANVAPAWEIELSTGVRLCCRVAADGIAQVQVFTLTPNIRAATGADHAGIVVLNDGAVPDVNALARERLARLHDASVYCRVAVNAGGIAGFLLALDERADYDSLNFRYFKDRYDRFVYVDRIVVHPQHHGQGIGRRLYEDLFEAVGTDVPCIACEVNLDPPNPRSLAFHQQLGFESVGEQLTEGGSKRVCLMIRRTAR